MTVEVHRTIDLPPGPAREALLMAVESPRLDGHALGWFPRAAYEGCHEQGRLLVCLNNGDLVGYVVHNQRTAPTRIFLTWVRQDARLILHGRALVDAVNDVAQRKSHTRIELWCATDLPANAFWEALGFQKICWRWSKGKSHRRHWLWRRPVLPTIATLHPTPSETSASYDHATQPLPRPPAAPALEAAHSPLATADAATPASPSELLARAWAR